MNFFYDSALSKERIWTGKRISNLYYELDPMREPRNKLLFYKKLYKETSKQKENEKEKEIFKKLKKLKNKSISTATFYNSKDNYIKNKNGIIFNRHYHRLSILSSAVPNLRFCNKKENKYTNLLSDSKPDNKYTNFFSTELRANSMSNGRLLSCDKKSVNYFFNDKGTLTGSSQKVTNGYVDNLKLNKFNNFNNFKKNFKKTKKVKKILINEDEIPRIKTTIYERSSIYNGLSGNSIASPRKNENSNYNNAISTLSSNPLSSNNNIHPIL